MKIEIDTKLSAYENAIRYFNIAKELKKKLEGMKNALTELDKKIEAERERLKKEAEILESQKRILVEKQWYERFNWSFTSTGKLVLIGRDEKQNEILVRNHLDQNDLFFHANIKGAATVILKDGKDSNIYEKLEVAQLAASYSRGWKESISYLDVYSVNKDQVTKSSMEGSLGTGGFLIIGEREWYKNTPLVLKIGLDKDRLMIVSEYYKRDLDKPILLSPGNKFSKGELAKRLSKYYNIHPDEFLMRLPAGSYTIRS